MTERALDRWQSRLQRWSQNPALRRAGHSVRWLLMAIIIGFLGWRLAHIGWRQTLAALPTHPAFYGLFLLSYFSLPLSETLIYKRLWGVTLRDFPMFLRKRVLNDSVLDYSGEAFLAVWATRTRALPMKQALHDVKDASILSGLCSNALTALLLLLFVTTGNWQALQPLSHGTLPWLLAGAGLGVGLIGVVALLGRRVIRQSSATVGYICSIHAVRLIANLGLTALQWSVALPGLGWRDWLMFLTVRLLVTRAPLLPNKDLAFAALAIALSSTVGAPSEKITALFLAIGVLPLLMNTLLFFILGLKVRR